MEEPTPDDRRGGRDDEDDQDLLTYGEAGARIRQELDLERARVAELQSQGAPAAQIKARNDRLLLLLEAQQRNVRGANDETFTDFFGYWPGQR